MSVTVAFAQKLGYNNYRRVLLLFTLTVTFVGFFICLVSYLHLDRPKTMRSGKGYVCEDETCEVLLVDIETMLRPFSLAEDDGLLVEHVRAQLVPPSTEPYRLTNPTVEDASYAKQPTIVAEITNRKKGGFFVDCGASDGEFYSNTLYLERQLNWTGLLVEQIPSVFQDLVGKNRKSWSLNACMGEHTYPYQKQIMEQKLLKKAKESEWMISDSDMAAQPTAQCYSLYTLLMALNKTTVDLLSLDVEKEMEASIFETVPWDKVDIKMILVENRESPITDEDNQLRELLTDVGYKLVHDFHPPYTGPDDVLKVFTDVLFVRKDSEYDTAGLQTLSIRNPEEDAMLKE